MRKSRTLVLVATMRSPLTAPSVKLLNGLSCAKKETDDSGRPSSIFLAYAASAGPNNC
jgi:hypothetical protein